MSTDTDNARDSTLILARGALLAGLCKFVPVPLLDDLFLRRAHQHLIASLLEVHGCDYDVAHLRPLYADSRGCVLSVLYLFLWLPVVFVVKLVKKLFKTIFFVLTIRDVALQIGYALLLGRAVERCLLDGRIPPPSESAASRHGPTWSAAERARHSIEQAFAGSDWRAIRTFIAGVFRGAHGMVSLGRSAVMDLFGRRASSDPAADRSFSDMPQESQAQVDSLARLLADALLQDEVRTYLVEFDTRFDAAWSSQSPDPAT